MDLSREFIQYQLDNELLKRAQEEKEKKEKKEGKGGKETRKA